MAKTGEIPVNINVSKELLELTRAIEIYQQSKTLIKILVRESCKNMVVDKEFIKKYGFDRAALLPAICQSFYEKGLKEAKNK